MAEHNELVAEMSILEQMGTQERQKLAKKRRLQQLKKWSQREKEWISKEKQLNKRLANKLNEENNGLNLKQYTTYSSNHRSKKKLQLSATGISSGNNVNGKSSNTINNNHVEFLNNNNNTSSNLQPNGRVHFNVGVMLLEAAARNDFSEVKRLLMLGVSPDSVNHDGLTALHQCCIDASEPMMNLLLEFGANVDAKDTEQWTPLHAACTCGHLNLVKILVENDANLLAVNGDGNMPFDICEDEATLDYIESQMVRRGITQEMIDFTRASTEMQMLTDLEKQVNEGKDLNRPDANGVTLLHIAAANGYVSAVKFLLKHGVNVNVCDNDQWQPIHGAACWGNEQHGKVIELLVEAGACLNAKTINDESVFDLCDNAELLEKLNQLKDELENKQESGTDRLRRTQSRTNSRVHSVRRTSVRDKNQISRREAREEALLRVENSPVPATTANSQHSDPTKQIKQDLEDNGVTEKNSVDNLPCLESSAETSLSSSNKKGSKTIFDQPDSSTLDDNERTTKDDEQSTTNLNHLQQEVNNLTNDRSQISLDDNKRKPLVKQFQNGDLLSTSKLSGSQSTSNIKLKQQQHSTSSNLQSQLSTKSLSNERVLIATATNDQVRVTEAQNHHNNNDAACDPSGQQHHQQVSQQAAVQLAPINCTLSSLKKQRSDLRMRTTSIGGGSTTSNGHLVVLDPQPVSPIGNGFHRPTSPSLTFRKFSGEPSEVIGGDKRNSRHNCCILI